MKTKVIVWYARNGGTAEKMLNEWLAQNAKIDVVNVTQSESGDVIASRRITYTIWYRE